MAHTPGPWIVRPSEDNGIPAVCAWDPKDGKKFEVCEVWGEDCDTEETKMSRANARLIAAAPDLLKAGKRMCAHFVTPNHGQPCDCGYCAMEAAISKATEGE